MIDQSTPEYASDALLEKCLKAVQGEITNLKLNLNEDQSRRIRELETELHRAKTVVDYLQGMIENTKSDYAKEKAELLEEYNKERDLHSQELQMIKGLDRRVLCLIDGDGTIFSLTQVVKGQAGGRECAAKLTESIRKYLPSDPFQLYVWVFLNKSGFLETLRKCGKEDARRNFDDFIKGFNQAADRFLMVDVGSGKEAVDAKIKAYMEDEAKCLQTIKIVFGGCHDNGYMTTLRSLITAGHASKIVLLQGYNEMAAGFHTLDLPCLKVDDLFEPEKFPSGRTENLSFSGVVPLSPSKDRVRSNSTGYTSLPASGASPGPRTQLHPIPSGSQGLVWRSSTTSPQPSRARHIDGNKPLSKQDPPPCNIFYLTKTCKLGSACSFAHDYLLTAEHIETMRENAKKSPCASMIRGETCSYGDSCCYGHKCPFGPKCHFYKTSICKFTTVGMHAD